MQAVTFIQLELSLVSMCINIRSISTGIRERERVAGNLCIQLIVLNTPVVSPYNHRYMHLYTLATTCSI